MDPNNQQPVPPTPQQPEALPPQQSPQPNFAMPPASPEAPAAPTTPQPTYSPVNTGGSKKGKTLKIVGIVAAVIVAALAVLVVLALPQLQARAKADSFMKSITTGDVTKAVEISGDPANKDFLTTSSEKVKGSYKQTGSSYENGTGYYLYELSGAQTKYARVTVKKANNGKWVVDAFVYSNDKLGVKPGKDQSTNSSSTTDTSTAASSTTNCLVKTDFNTIEQANNGGNAVGNIDYSKPSYIGTYLSGTYVGIAYYLPDSLNFDTQNDIAGYTNDKKVASFADFYKANSSKQFVFHLEGVVALNDKASLDFGLQRANKVKNTLLSLGVPADRIVVDSPQNISTYGAGAWKGQENDPTAQRMARSVSISIVPPDACFKDGAGR